MNPDAQTLDPRKQRYRVMLGEEIIGQFSNQALAMAEAAARGRGNSVVLDVSVRPPRIVFQNGRWIGEAE